ARRGLRTPADECHQASDAPASALTFAATVHSEARLMSLPTSIAIYFIIWWVVLFAVLPWGVRSQQEHGAITPGSDPGAPAIPGGRRVRGLNASPVGRRSSGVSASRSGTAVSPSGWSRSAISPRRSAFRDDKRARRARATPSWQEKIEQGRQPCSQDATPLNATLTPRILCYRSRRLRLYAGLFLPRLGPRGR